MWSIGYTAAVVLTLICAVVMWRRASDVTVASTTATVDADTITWSRRARWIALAFVPSSLMLAVTAYLSTDVAAVPLLWVVPLALYLITFVVTFSTWSTRVVAACQRMFPLVLLYLTWMLISEARLPLAAMAATHLVAFFVIATLCHGTVSEDRPAPTRLTDFYLSLAVGGALGGVFNSLVAPVLFTSVLEYPLALAAGILLLTFRRGTSPLLRTQRWWVQPTLVAILTIVALKWRGTGIPGAAVTWGLLLGAVLVCLSVSRDRRRLGVCVLLMLGLYAAIGGRGFVDVAYASRTFFGTYRVVSDPEQQSFTLFHGTTVHGRQDVASGEPLTYYHRESPIAQVLATRPAGTVTSVGAVGLGTGTLAAYVQPDQTWTFYEIDPEVERIARDARYFTHLATCDTRCQVVVGDARLSLQARSERHDVIVLDAFSSDAIPIHLITREAVDLYLSRLNTDGVLAIHISNNYLDLRPVVAGVMRDLGLAGRVQYQPGASVESGRFGSHWAVLARSEAALGALAGDTRWARLRPRDERAWTDDFSNVWSVIQWRWR
jgi:hypothetical protein